MKCRSGAGVLAALIAATGLMPRLSPQEYKPLPPTFGLTIAEDVESARSTSGLHRIVVTLTRLSPGAEIEAFHPEAENMYEMLVLRDGTPVPEKVALKALQRFRIDDPYPTIDKPRTLPQGKSWTTLLDLGSYFDMSVPGQYVVTVSRRSPPHDIDRQVSTVVRSNTIALAVLPHASVMVGEKPRPRFSLVASKPVSEQEYPVWIHVDRTNISGTTIRESKCWPFLEMYAFRVLRNGQALEPNQSMQKLDRLRAMDECPGNETLNEFADGEVEEEDIPLSNFYDLTKSGSYVVYVNRESDPWNPDKSETVSSNPLTFEIHDQP
ncbi:MAG TPA: hypothetical protein VGN16_23800 [Acidobacteriaceae bacterium]|jgi:hypothetical protein